MSEALTIHDPIGRVVETVTSDDAPTLDEFAAELGLSPAEAVAILTDRDVSKALQDTTKARARLALHGRGISQLIKILDEGDTKEKLSALSMLGKLAGDFKPKSLQVHHTFDELISRPTTNAGPLAGITQITEGVIDAEEADDTDD